MLSAWSPYTLLFAFLAAFLSFVLVVALLVMWLNGRFARVPLAPPPNASPPLPPLPAPDDEPDVSSPLAYAAVAAQSAARHEKKLAALAAEGIFAAPGDEIPGELPAPEETLRPLPAAAGGEVLPPPEKERYTPTGLWQMLAAIACGPAALLGYSVLEDIYGPMQNFTFATALAALLLAGQIAGVVWLVRIQRRLEFLS